MPRAKRIVIPPTLQSLLRTFCCFPGIDNLVEKQVQQCIPCQAVNPPTTKEPVQPSEFPKGHWQYFEMDFQTTNKYLLLLIDTADGLS